MASAAIAALKSLPDRAPIAVRRQRRLCETRVERPEHVRRPHIAHRDPGPPASVR